MRTTLIALLALGTLTACDQERVPEKLPPAKIVPAEPEPEAEKTSPIEIEAGDSKGVGAAGCASDDCKAACEGHEQPECAEAYAHGCFTDEPPADKGCEKFAQKPSVTPRSGEQPKKKLKARGEDVLEAKATPIGD